jgi:long-chain acyl-CoA synthetase
MGPPFGNNRSWLHVYPDWMPHNLTLTPNTMLDLFGSSTAKRPDTPAVYYFDREIPYKDIDRLSSSLSAAFHDLEIRKGDRIALALRNVPQFLVAQYAVWKAGAVVVPLNPGSKEGALTYYLQDSGAKILVIHDEILSLLGFSFLKKTSVSDVITTSPLDMVSPETELIPLLKRIIKTSVPGTLDMWELLTRYRGREATDPGLSRDDVAYLNYAPWKSGRSKGVMNTHGNVVFNAGVYKAAALIDENDIILGASPLFNITGEIAHLALAALSSIPVILYYKFDPGEILRLIERWRATMMVAPSATFEALMNHPDIRQRDILSLKKAYCEGAPIPSAMVNQFEDITGLYIYNVYGLTETTSHSHITPLGKRMPYDHDSGTLAVGLPVPNSEAKIMGLENGQGELGPGEIGEIVVKGPMVMPGYWGKPEETGCTLRDGWLHTGQAGKRDQEGWFYLAGKEIEYHE